VNTINNIIYNKDNYWFAFTANNKIIVELLEENRTQIILEEHQDEISVYKILINNLKSLYFTVFFEIKKPKTKLRKRNTANIDQ